MRGVCICATAALEAELKHLNDIAVQNGLNMDDDSCEGGEK